MAPQKYAFFYFTQTNDYKSDTIVAVIAFLYLCDHMQR